MVPTSAKSYVVQKYLGDRWRLENTDNNTAPTFAGKMPENRPIFVNQTDNNVKLELPKGIGWSVMPMPIIQAGVGLPFHTEIIGRFFPPVSLGGYGKINLWGVGLKHDIKEDLPIIKYLPFLQLAGLIGYTQMGMNFEVNEKQNQTIDFNTSAFTARLIGGINVPFVAVYLGLGYGYSSCNFDLKGLYTVSRELAEDPISLSIKNNTFDANLGVRLKLALLTIHGDYTIGEYQVIAVGVGVALR
jgi:hypothetical protein